MLQHAAAPSSSVADREGRIFHSAFGMMDSDQEGEAIAAFLRVRQILHRRESGFRNLLEHWREHELVNAELGRENSMLRRENGALKTRRMHRFKQRSKNQNMVNGRLRSILTPEQWNHWHWDLGALALIIASGVGGLLGPAATFALSAAVLISAAFANWFSPLRFVAGTLLGLAAYVTLGPIPARPASSPQPHTANMALLQTQESSATVPPVTMAPAPPGSPANRTEAPPSTSVLPKQTAKADCSHIDCGRAHREITNIRPDKMPAE